MNKRTRTRNTKAPPKKPAKSNDEAFPLPCSLYLIRDQKAGTMRMRSQKDLKRLNRKLDLPGQRTWLRYEMRRIMRTTLHEDADNHQPAHQAWRYCSLLEQLWTWLEKMMVKARNPNTRNHAARTLGGLIHRLGTRSGKKWIKDSAAQSEEFRHALYPFGEGGGKPPKEDLLRWIRGEMTHLEHHWLKATKVARKVELGRFESLKAAWMDYFKSLPARRLRTDYERELCGHPLTKLDYATLTEFPLLWDAALCSLFSADWKQEKKAGKLKVKGDTSFVKRFGDTQHSEAGYYAAERYFQRWWQRKLASQIESEIAMRQIWEDRKRELTKRMGKSEMSDDDFDLALANEFLEHM